ncbi:dynein axonemal intermediate chain 7 isoform X2 [Callorhinchus milii]|uniref:dynein axonemal intermediate chain 7 isoform X2 n=1 Tax=Callorhinchus milii TaxID=7868 RepID=UPI001C3F4FA4|nr:dynein axonemal intermediate chain 7 isoform X2 [Callorhinchus milii]
MKGKKKSKLDDKVSKEEEEKNYLEEEEARLKAEREERERKERERLEQEERARIAAEDKERKEIELPELRHILEVHEHIIHKQLKLRRQNIKWARYMRCDGTPDPAILDEINTFINLSAENPMVEIKFLLEECRTILKLINELESLLIDTPASEMDSPIVLQHQRTIVYLQELVSQKNDKVTEYFLQNAVSLVDIETGNMQEVVGDENVTQCVWANLNKNPRFKGYDFQEAKMEFELPKALTMCDIAVRIMHVHYDHLTCLEPVCQMLTNSNTKVKVGVHATFEENMHADNELSDDDTKQTTQSDKSKQLLSVSSPDDTKSQTPSKEKVNGIRDVKTPTLEAEIISNGLITPSPTDREKHLLPHLPVGMGVTPPMSQHVTPPQSRPLTPPIDLEDGFTADLNEYTPLGGVFYFDVLKLPPQPTFINGWTIVQVSDTGLQMYPYPSERVRQTNSNIGTDIPEEREGEIILPSLPAGIRVQLPNTAMFFEQPTPARWNPAANCWVLDGISNIQFDEEEKTLGFKMDTFNIFTMLQRAHVNMPFKSWLLRPTATTEAMFTVVAIYVEVNIVIQVKGLCRLNPLPEDPESEDPPETDNLAHIRGKWMSASSLMYALKNSGLNIFPGYESDAYVEINAKHKQLELDTYIQMALVASTIGFKSSKWNSESGENDILLQATEHLQDAALNDGDWSLLLLTPDRSNKLKMKESDETYSKDIAENSNFYSNLYHTVMGESSEATAQRIRYSDHLFIDSVHKLLCGSKMLTYTNIIN